MIISMKRLTLIALQDDEQAILKALQRISAVQIIETDAEVPDNGTLAALEDKVARISDALAALKPYAPKKGMFAPETEATADALFAALPKGLADSERIDGILRDLAQVRSEIEKNCAVIAQLEPWSDFPGDMQTYQHSKYAKYFTGLLPVTELSKLDGFTEFIEYQCFNEAAVRSVLVACEPQEAKNVSTMLKSLQWTDVAFPKMPGTPGAAMARLTKQNEELSKRLETLKGQIAEMGGLTEEISKAYEAAVIERDRAKAAVELARTSATFMLEGWIRSDDEEKVRAAVASVTDACYLETREPTEEETPPSVVKNNAFVTPFEAVTNLYSRPDPRGIDGTPYMTPFYILLFGLMLSDTGYGLILSLGCWLFNKYKKPTGMMGSLAHVLFWGGLSTAVWGVLVGSFFGLDFDVVFGTANVFPLLVDPMAEPIGMLILCFGLGILHILFGVGIKMKMSFDRGDWQTAIFDNFSWMLIIPGLIMLALPQTRTAGTIMALAGALMILLFKGRAKKNVVSRTISGLGELYQVTSYLSDILSYSRLFALGIATGVIASVFNDICSMLMSSPNIILKILGIIVACALLVALHLFNIGINTLGAFVHCARLQYVEFYGKFYEAGGKEFKPLGMKPKRVRLTDNNS